ncbi:hypothetical protein VIGAN_03161700, partial [Vigna angularis var. angularis]
LRHLSHLHLSLHTPSSPSSQRHFLKLDVPRFDGTNALGWIFKITQFFDYHNTPEEDRIIVASFYLDVPQRSDPFMESTLAGS